MALALTIIPHLNIFCEIMEKMVTTQETRTENMNYNQTLTTNSTHTTELWLREDHTSNQHLQHTLLHHHREVRESQPLVC